MYRIAYSLIGIGFCVALLVVLDYREDHQKPLPATEKMQSIDEPATKLLTIQEIRPAIDLFDSASSKQKNETKIQVSWPRIKVRPQLMTKHQMTYSSLSRQDLDEVSNYLKMIARSDDAKKYRIQVTMEPIINSAD